MRVATRVARRNSAEVHAAHAAERSASTSAGIELAGKKQLVTPERMVTAKAALDAAEKAIKETGMELGKRGFRKELGELGVKGKRLDEEYWRRRVIGNRAVSSTATPKLGVPGCTDSDRRQWTHLCVRVGAWARRAPRLFTCDLRRAPRETAWIGSGC